MKSRINDYYVIACVSTLAFLATAICTLGQTETAESSHHKKIMSGKMVEHCTEMKQERQKMMAEMKAQDAEIDALVVKMNSAPKDKKLDLLADIITRMVKQRSAMHANMDKMKGTMMDHMQMRTDRMSDCPMWKETNEKTGGAQHMPE
jgi:hypothetical protein